MAKETEICLQFYRSFYESAQTLIKHGEAERVNEFYAAIINYYFEGIEPDFSDDEKGLLEISWVQISATLNHMMKSQKEYLVKSANGKKGGSKPKTKSKTEKQKEQQNININKKINENENINASSYEAESPAPNPFEDEDLLEKANHASDVTLFEDGQPTAETFDISPPKSKGEILDYMQSKGHALEHLNVERFWNYYSQRGWRSKTGVPVIWRQKVDEWVVDDQREKIAELEERRRAGGS